MSPVSNTILSRYLSQPEQVAQKLGTVKFIGWQCPHCRLLLGDEAFHLRAYVLNLPNYQECQTCREVTLEYKNRVLQAATEYSAGTKIITEDCHCCGYHAEQDIIIPRLPVSDYSSSNNSSSSISNSSSWSSDNSTSSYSSDSSSTSTTVTASDSGSSWSSDSGGSSDFGGGSSGGGGAGGDW